MNKNQNTDLENLGLMRTSVRLSSTTARQIKDAAKENGVSAMRQTEFLIEAIADGALEDYEPEDSRKIEVQSVIVSKERLGEAQEAIKSKGLKLPLAIRLASNRQSALEESSTSSSEIIEATVVGLSTVWTDEPHWSIEVPRQMERRALSRLKSLSPRVFARKGASRSDSGLANPVIGVPASFAADRRDFMKKLSVLRFSVSDPESLP